MRAETLPLPAAPLFLGVLSPARAEAAARDAGTTRTTVPPASAPRDTAATEPAFLPPPTGIQRSRLTVEPFPEPPLDTGRIDIDAQRKIGAASLEDAVRFHRAAAISVLPISGPTEGSLELPDGGGPVRLLTSFLDTQRATDEDRKSTRLNSSHTVISYAV